MNDSLQSISQKIEECYWSLNALGVTKLGLFGSYIRNEQTDESDLDFLVEFDPAKKSFDNFFAVAELLEHVFKKPVDLLTTESLSPYMGPHILQEVHYFAIPA